MRIAVINNFFPPRVGGSAYVADTMARFYASQGHEVLVITTAYGGGLPDETRDGIRIVRVPSWALPETRFSFNFDITFALKPGNRRRVYQLLDDFKPDVIHQHGQFFDLTWKSGAWARRNNVPTVLTLHTRLISPRRFTDKVFRALDLVIVKPILRRHRPARMVAIDVVFSEYIRKRYGWPDDQVVAIPVGVEVDRFKDLDLARLRNATRKELGFGDEPVIASVGHVIPLRDRLGLIEALPAVLEEHPTTKVLVIGGVYFPKFLERAKELGVEGALVCTGAVAKDAVPGLLAASDMEIHELQGFGIGIASMEAMCAELPTVMTERPDYFPGMVLETNRDTILLERGDTAALAAAVVTLIDDPGLRSRIGKAGRDFVFTNLDMHKLCAANLQLLESVAAPSA